VNLQLALGICALSGHVFPVFAGFRGGKGVATILGIVICLTPITSTLVLLVFLMILISTRYVSLSSILAGISYPIFLNLVLKNENQTLLTFSVLVAILLIITHKKNITRLLKKEEARVKLFASSKN
jgi:glycerol-3-phosphate acyltransferase PlsY